MICHREWEWRGLAPFCWRRRPAAATPPLPPPSPFPPPPPSAAAPPRIHEKRSNAAFLTVTQGASGAGDGTIQFSVAPNTGPQRTAALTVTDTAFNVADTVVTITQSAP